MDRRIAAIGLVLAAGACLFAACSATKQTQSGGGSGGGGASATAGSAGTSGSGADIGVGGGGDCTGGTHCSADLHSLVDCAGNVVMTCPDDQGCSGSTCVPACSSAGDNKSTFGCDYYVVGPDILLQQRHGLLQRLLHEQLTMQHNSYSHRGPFPWLS